VNDLIEFLLARIADDEAYARNAFGDHNDVVPEWSEIWSGAVNIGGNAVDGPELLLTNDSQVSRHIERWDPARVLAECEAKRRIVEELREAFGSRRVGLIFRQLALPYADHPDYDERWRP